MAVPSDSGEAPVQAIRGSTREALNVSDVRPGRHKKNGSTREALNVFPFLRSTVPIREKTIFPLDRSQKTPCRKTIGKAFFMGASHRLL